ncbi:hypothetical protein SDJN02_11394, partial [Cucurbita argyrosperma subsp. argyrosperma]
MRLQLVGEVFLSLIFHATVFAEIIFDYGLLDFCFPASSRSCFLPLSSSTLRWWIVVSAGIGSRLQLPAEGCFEYWVTSEVHDFPVFEEL